MRINIASRNPVKVQAVRELIKEYDFLAKAEIVSLKAEKAENRANNQPRSLEETIQGAISRARAVFTTKCDYSFGIEGGLMEVPHTKTGYMEISACAIYDGKESYLGLSCAFELPRMIIEEIYDKNLTLNEALYKCDLTKKKNINTTIGAIGLLTKGRVTRKKSTKQAVQMALVHLENVTLYY